NTRFKGVSRRSRRQDEKLRHIAVRRLVDGEQDAVGDVLRPETLRLFEPSDLVVYPYWPGYHLGSSAVSAEALANGIRVVVPAGTPLETLMMECGGPGTAFSSFDPASSHWRPVASLIGSTTLRCWLTRQHCDGP